MSRLENGTSEARSRAMRAASAGSDARTGVSVIRALRNARAYGTSAALSIEIELTPTRRDSGASRSRAALQPLVEACLLSMRTHSVPFSPAGQPGVEASHLVREANGLAIWLDPPAFVDRKFAARCERAARRQVSEIRWTSGNGRQAMSFEPAAVGAGRQEPERIGMPRFADNVKDGTELDNFARIHDRDLVRHFHGHADIVGDEDDCQTKVALQLPQDQQNLDLHCCIECRRRLVGQQHLGFAAERQRNHGALPHATRQLVGVGVESLLRRGNSYSFEQLQRPPAPLRARYPFVPDDCLGDLIAHAIDRIECYSGVLKNHGYEAAAEVL